MELGDSEAEEEGEVGAAVGAGTGAETPRKTPIPTANVAQKKKRKRGRSIVEEEAEGFSLTGERETTV